MEENQQLHLKLYRLNDHEFYSSYKGQLQRVEKDCDQLIEIMEYEDGFYGIFKAFELGNELRIRGGREVDKKELLPQTMISTPIHSPNAQVMSIEQILKQDKYSPSLAKFEQITYTIRDASIYRFEKLPLGQKIFLKLSTNFVSYSTSSYDNNAHLGFIDGELREVLLELLKHRVNLQGYITKIHYLPFGRLDVEITILYKKNGLALKMKPKRKYSLPTMSEETLNSMYYDDPTQYDEDKDESRTSGAYF